VTRHDSRMAHVEDARGDLSWAGRVLAQAEGMQLLMDEKCLGQARVVGVHESKLATANVHGPTAGSVMAKMFGSWQRRSFAPSAKTIRPR